MDPSELTFAQLANKPCYPSFDGCHNYFGLTFRERLIIALASNPTIFSYSGGETAPVEKYIISQADAIIKEMSTKL